MSKSRITTEKKLPPIHPGRILLEDLKDEQISINGLAQAIRVPANRISLIVNEKGGITADTAARLGRYFGTSAQILAEHSESLRSRLHRLGRD
jgi:addiction module HigA family antidote